MRHALRTFVLTAAMAACAPAWADLVVFSASGSSPASGSSIPQKGDWSVTFNSADTTLTFDEIVAGSFTGTTYELSYPPSVTETYDVIRQIATGVPTLNFGGKTYTVVGNDISDSWCLDGRWCFAQSSGIEQVATVVGSWTQYQITSVAAVPEPGSLALLGVALAGLTLTRRRKQ